METLKLSRRTFLLATGAVGTGLMVGISFWSNSGDNAALAPAKDGFIPNALLQITSNNDVRFYCPRDEMGQGITTGLTTLIAEELDVPPAKIDVAIAGAHPAYVNPEFGVQVTGGSTSMHAHFSAIRQMAANVRKVLLQAAAASLKVSVSELHTEDAYIIAPSGRFPYGKFVGAAAHLDLPTDALLKARSRFKYIGREFPRLDAIAKSTGTTEFGLDVEIPGQLYAIVRRCPVWGGKVASVDKDTALRMPGVIAIVPVSTGIAVVAERFWQAKKAGDAIKIEWDLPALSNLNTEDIKADYVNALEHEAGQHTAVRGDIDRAFKSAAMTIESTYWTPFLAHAPLEPMNALVRVDNGRADVWSGTQAPAIAQGLVARHAGLHKSNVHIHNRSMGGSFGRRGVLTHIIEATETALQLKQPVQVIWTRDNDLKNGFLRPASLMRIKAAADNDGRVIGWQATRVGDNIAPWSLDAVLPGILPPVVPQSALDVAVATADTIVDNWMVDPQSVEGLHEDYDFPNREIVHITKSHGLPLTYWRSVGHSYTAFAKESAIDELAHASGHDSAEFRIANTKNTPRLQRVIRIAGEYMRKNPAGPGRALGLAAHTSFRSYVAQVAEVSVTAGTIRVHKILCVVDCGGTVNPDIVHSQMEGSIMFGLTAALHGELSLRNGAIAQANFDDYPILRMHEAPDVEVIIVESDEHPSGVGEPGVPPVAPAVANAVFVATGQRLRALPLRLS